MSIIGYFFKNDKSKIPFTTKKVIESIPTSSQRGSRSLYLGAIYNILEYDPTRDENRFYNTITVEIMRVTTQSTPEASPNRVSLGTFEFDATWWRPSNTAYQKNWGCDTLIAEHPECTVTLQADSSGQVTLSIQGSNSYYWYVSIFASYKARD